MCLYVVIVFPSLYILMYDCPLLSPVIAQLEDAGLDTSAGCRILLDPTCLVEVLSRKPPEVVARTNEILKTTRFKCEKEFRVLDGK